MEWWAETEGMATMQLLRRLRTDGMCAGLYDMIREGVVLGDASAPIFALLCDTCRATPAARARMTKQKDLAPGLGQPGCDVCRQPSPEVAGWEHWLGGGCPPWRTEVMAGWAAVAEAYEQGGWAAAGRSTGWAARFGCARAPPARAGEAVYAPAVVRGAAAWALRESI